MGARLISHAGSLLNLAKHPASTVQILGSEKALFKALKTNHDTPKYGLIYHAQLVGGSTTALKGKASRMLAAKAALGCRVDALGEDVTPELGVEHRAKLEARLRQLEGGNSYKVSGTGKQSAKFDKYENKSEVLQYKAAADSNLKRKLVESDPVTPKKVKVEEEPEDEGKSEKKKKKKKNKNKDGENMDVDDAAANGANGDATAEAPETPKSEKKKKKKKNKENGD